MWGDVASEAHASRRGVAGFRTALRLQEDGIELVEENSCKDAQQRGSATTRGQAVEDSSFVGLRQQCLHKTLKPTGRRAAAWLAAQI